MNPKLIGAATLFLAAVAILAVFLLLPEPLTPAPRQKQPSNDAAARIVTTDLPPGIPEIPAPPARLRTSEQQITVVPGEEEWMEQLDNLLGADEETSITARKLIAALPSLPPEAQEEYVAHAVNLCEDGDFAQLEQVYLAANTPPPVVEMIFDDSLNRPDEVKLPMLAKTMRNPSHPMAEEAREILEMYLDLEPGATPGTGWDAAVQEYLRAEASAE